MAPRSKSRRPRRIAVLVTFVVLVALAAGAAELQVAAAQSESGFAAARGRLDADLQTARDRGYSESDLQPIETKESGIAGITDPIWVSDRPGYYEQRATQLDQLHLQLQQLEASLLAAQRQSTSAALQKAAEQLSQATGLGADPDDLAQLHAQLSAAEDAEAIAKQPRDFGPVESEANAVLARAQQLATAQQADLQAIQQAATDLQTKDNSDAAKLRKDAQSAIAAGRNDATVAAYMHLAAVSKPYNKLERYSALLSIAGSDAAKLAMAAAGAQHYREAIHQSLLASFPHKVVVISYQAQELWAYEGGKLVQDTLITSGRPQLPTDTGAMKVISKNSPWKMHSPWPRTSQWWYPDTTVQMAIWFTDTGESMHDAYWEYSSQYGPGGQYGGAASHGCVHVPYDSEKFLYSWTAIGMPVIVYPGDGSTVANQVAQITVDANGNPTTGPKGV